MTFKSFGIYSAEHLQSIADHAGKVSGYEAHLAARMLDKHDNCELAEAVLHRADSVAAFKIAGETAFFVAMLFDSLKGVSIDTLPGDARDSAIDLLTLLRDGGYMVPYEADMADAYATAEQIKISQEQRHAELNEKLAAARAKVAHWRDPA
jgi:hypothetical protein